MPGRTTTQDLPDDAILVDSSDEEIIVAEAYLVTSSAPRALMLITLSKTAMSVSIGVAISPGATAPCICEAALTMAPMIGATMGVTRIVTGTVTIVPAERI